MSQRPPILLVLAWLPSLGAGVASAQDNPWRTTPRTPPAVSSPADERGFTQGYLRGFEQGYRRGAEQAGSGAPTANLGTRAAPPVATGAVPDSPSGDGLGAGMTALPPGGLAPSAGSAAARGTPRGPQQIWGEYPPLDGDRPPPPRTEPSAPPRAAAYPYPHSGAQTAAPAPPPAVAPPYVGYAAPYGPYTAPYGFNPALGGPSTLGTQYGGYYGTPYGSPYGGYPGMGPVPGIPFLGGF
jgi:hypothetical protein